MIELLIAIAIIGVLATLAIRSAGALIGVARLRATQGTLRKINGLLSDRMEAFNQRALQTMLRNKDFVDDPNITGTATYATYAGNFNSMQSSPRSEVLARKGYFRRYFPQTWAEAGTTWGGASLLSEVGETAPPVAASPTVPRLDPTTESAEVLYFILTKARALGRPPVGSDTFTTSEFQVSAISGKPYFVDAWGNPLRFYRWPTRLIRPPATPPTASDPINRTIATLLISSLPPLSASVTIDPLSIDPDDPLAVTDGTSNIVTSSGSVTWTSYISSNSWPAYETAFHTAGTYHTPLVVSAGPDGELGLREPNDLTATLGRLAAPIIEDANGNGNLDAGEDTNGNGVLDDLTRYDNVTNLNIQAGAR